MHIKSFLVARVSILLLLVMLYACKGAPKPPAVDIVTSPEKLDESASDNIRRSLAFALSNDGNIGDSTMLFRTEFIDMVYDKNEYVPIWSSSEQWKPLADSLYLFIDHAKLYGLFPEDYHFPRLQMIRNRFLNDSLATGDRRDAALWAKADLMLTDAFVHIVNDLKLGRLPKDSITLRKDSVLTDDFIEQQLNILLRSGSVVKTVRHLEPRHEGYHLLKNGIPHFLDSIDHRTYTMVPSFKDDSLNFKSLLQKRLFEEGYIAFDSIPADSVHLAKAVKRFQQANQLTVDGIAGGTTLRMLNTTDKERFARIALTLDKFKMFADKMPERFIWVNLPSYALQLHVKDTVRLVSKIICGKPKTRTPLLTSAISEIITYPQWTVPSSIIEKEMLPAIKRDPGYLAQKGFSLVDKDGEEVDPWTVDWSKYKKGIPYKVVQGSGDDNALGVLKFNFPNKYAVYLHDTNQRHLFSKTSRSLSHGCVRVKEWQPLAWFILQEQNQDTLLTRPLRDSLNTWLERKEKHSISLKKRLPVFIRYHTCEGQEKGIVFFDDIYEEDKRLLQQYFAGKY